MLHLDVDAPPFKLHLDIFVALDLTLCTDNAAADSRHCTAYRC
jgi:hypothetical protein